MFFIYSAEKFSSYTNIVSFNLLKIFKRTVFLLLLLFKNDSYSFIAYNIFNSLLKINFSSIAQPGCGTRKNNITFIEAKFMHYIFINFFHKENSLLFTQSQQIENLTILFSVILLHKIFNSIFV